ncbi:hypothetical protein [Nonomuraea sp. SYSU D8015]|uniref:hypothetical protein n=1 Tax=Nonomuraea sp. SYSU D8015 TaxID=2593644 RepID=UPI001CB6E21D|nr:hypothetical protein [Nonomuraea sp. SYSU D8015]
MDIAVTRHPLTVLLDRKHWTYETFLGEVAERHRARGYGTPAARKEKVTRWITGVAVPQPTTQLAIADVFGIPEREVEARGWPYFLLVAFDDDRTIWESPWTPAGTLQALDHLGGSVDRRGFLVTSTGTLAAIAAQWATAEPAQATLAGGRRIGREVADMIDSRLDALRHLDDQVGAGQVYDAAAAELRLIRRLLTETTHTEQIGRRLYGAAAEASRLAGWCAYDVGHQAAAEKHYDIALRASASAGTDTLGAIIFAFWGNLRYTNDDPRGALHLFDGALNTAKRITSPRVKALLHARRARAYSLAGEPLAAYQAIDAAFATYAHAGPTEADLPSMYWLNAGELHQFAGSAALSLGEPRRALCHFDLAVNGDDPYDTEKEARGTAIYLARRAEAHLALGELDAAVQVAEQVVQLMGGVESARGSSALNGLRADLLKHRDTPVVENFLDLTA